MKPVSGTPQFATSGNPQNSIPATVWPAYAANMLMTELYNIVLASGITPSGTDWAQVWQAMLCIGVFQDVGVVNAMRTVLPNIVNQPNSSSVFNNLRVGTQVRVIIANTNTSGTVTLNAFNLGAVQVLRRDGSTPAIGDFPVGQLCEFIYDGTHWRGDAGFFGVFKPTPLAGLTLWVRTDGNDGNDGTTNTAGHAFATIQGAMNFALNGFVLAGKPLVIRIGNSGTFAPPILTSAIQQMTIIGDSGVATNHILSGAGFPGASGVLQATGCNVTLVALQINNTATTTNWLATSAGGVFNLQNVRFTANVSNSVQSLMRAFAGGTFSLADGIVLAANAGSALLAGPGGSIECQTGSTITFTGSPTWSNAFTFAFGGAIEFSATGFSGTSIGKKYIADMNGIVNTETAGGSNLPGTIAGTTARGGQIDTP